MSKHVKAMSRALYVAKRFINQYIWRPLQLLAEVVHPVPALSAFLLFFLFAHVGQLQEIYSSALEPPFDSSKSLHLLWALIALVLLSGALFHINYALSTLTINIIYSRSSSYHTDSWLKVVRTVLGLVVAGAPWLGLLVGMQRAAHRTLDEAERVRMALQPFKINPETVLPQLAAIDVLPGRISWVMLAVFVLGVATLGVLHVCRRKTRFWSAGVVVVCAALFVILLVPSLVTGISGKLEGASPIDAVVYYRSIGALAMIIVVALGLLASVAVMAYLADQIGFPLIPVTIVLVVTATIMHWPPHWIASIASVAFVLITVLGVLSRRWPLAILSLTFALLSLSVVRQLDGNAISIDTSSGQPKSAHLALRERFVDWLADRSEQREKYVRDRGKDYPVFVIAAQGGGIYAATAAAAFLSRLQDRCPGFAGHVFAISGVSGGAVGSAIFQSLMQTSNPQAAGCRGDANEITPALSQQSANVVLDDHLAPLLGLLPADLIGLESDRSHALEESFIRSVAQHGGSGALKGTFDAHWPPKSVAPALLLNATWVETGYRVAFAPFTLGGMRDGTLYAFGDANLAIGSAVESLSLAGAAVVSARFPGVVPAFSFKRITRKGNEEIEQRWNFVDGGYADESGSATALEVYRELEKTIDARGERNIDLRLVLLTNATPAPDFSRIQGTPARDFLAPALTLLSVRDLLAKQAIMRTVTEIDPNNAKDLQWRISPSQRGEREKWKVAIVELDQESFTLALGWNLSRATQAIVSLLVGRPELCPEAPNPSGPTAAPDTTSDSVSQKAGEMKISTQIIRANSCVTRALEKLISTAP